MVLRPDTAIFSALADSTRLEIIECLQDSQALATTDLAEATAQSRQSVKKHLDVLAEAGLVRDSRVGRRRMWRLDARPLASVNTWTEHIRTQWETRFNQLDALLLAEQGDP